MGRQTQFHMLPADCQRFLEFVRGRDPVIVTRWYASNAQIEEIHRPWEEDGHYCLWNQALLRSLERHQAENRFGIAFELPVIEFSYSAPAAEFWNRQHALIQGRVWASFEGGGKDFARWYNALARWIRRNFIRDRGIGLEGFIGPAAYQWFRDGGLLLPGFRPPLTEAWLAWVDVQNQHRAAFVGTMERTASGISTRRRRNAD